MSYRCLCRHTADVSSSAIVNQPDISNFFNQQFPACANLGGPGLRGWLTRCNIYNLGKGLDVQVA